MEPAYQAAVHYDGENKDLAELNEVFGTQFSLKDITSAYFQADRNKNIAGEILCGMEGSTSGISKLEADNVIMPNSGQDGVGAMPSGNRLLKASYDGARELKLKKCSASMGTVSGVIGKEYINPRPLATSSVESKKPLKLDSHDFPVNGIWSEEDPPSVQAKYQIMHADVEDFLFKMLGDGFKLESTVILEVLGQCGYDMQKSVDKLLDLSALTLENHDDVVCMAAKTCTKKCPNQEPFVVQEQMQLLESSQSDGAGSMVRDPTDPMKAEKDRSILQQEILQTLFDVPDMSREVPKKTVRVRRSRGFVKPVFKPLISDTRKRDISAEAKVVSTEEIEDDENSYEVLREAVKEYWITMKLYYKASTEAFVKGDHARAQKLLEKGHFFNERAREADEKSCKKLLETREAEVVPLHFHDLDPKASLRLLRFHLTTLSGIPAIKYLKLVFAKEDGDASNAKTKRLIIKQLERESIKWTDAGDGQIILIQVDILNPTRFSFAEK